MANLLLTNVRLITGSEILDNYNLVIKNGYIERISDQIPTNFDDEIIDGNNQYLLPGFIDLQVNGGAGAYFTKDLNKESLIKIAEAHLEYGTTSFLPTIISTSMENILKAIRVTEGCLGQYGILGMHLEGPYFNKIKMGAHQEKYLHTPSGPEIDELITEGAGVIKLITLAPEVISETLLKRLKKYFKIAAGHSNCSYNEARKGFDNGIDMVTHLFNAMSQFESRNPGLVGAFLNSDSWGSIIIDGTHVDYAAVEVAMKIAKDRLFIVSDASFIKHPVNQFEFDGFKIHYHEGHYYNESGSLAGASITMFDAFKNLITQLNTPWLEATRMSSSLPATYLGIDNQVGYLKPGLKADMLLISEDLQLNKVIQSGKVSRT